MGTRHKYHIVFTQVRDHPHAYGDKFSPSLVKTPVLGSSPRVWGQAMRAMVTTAPMRIIPTRMGTSFCKYLFGLLAEDHPHAYGDKSGWYSEPYSVKGSSPRVWGQETVLICQILQKRIIPTRMGTRRVLQAEIPPRQDHPHAYGDKCTSCSQTLRP